MTENTTTLVDFVLQYCTCLPDTPAPAQTDVDLTCPICLTHLLDSTHHVIRIDLLSCHYSFDADCLSRYFLAGHNKCPLCRSERYDIPKGARTAQTIVEDGLSERLQDLMEALLRLRIMVREAEVIDDDLDEFSREHEGRADEQRESLQLLLEPGFRMLSEDEDNELLDAKLAARSDTGDRNTAQHD